MTNLLAFSLVFFRAAFAYPSEEIRSDLYGDYHICIENYSVCRGHMLGAAGHINLTVHHENKKSIVMANTTIFNDTGSLKQRIKIMRLKKKKWENIINFNTDSPCDSKIDLMLKDIFEFEDLKKCTVKKISKIFIVDATHIAKKYLGKTFFYGRYKVTLAFFTSVGNIGCFTIDFELAKIGSCK